MRVGFLGLGAMGSPMARNLCRKFNVTVWNRSDSKYGPLIEAGAKIGKTPSQVIHQSDFVFTMLFDGAAIQSIIDTDTDFFKALRGKTLINTSSVSVDFSHSLARQVHQAGGNFIEMPVSGSKLPAEQGKLVGLMAGDPNLAEQIKPVVEPFTSTTVYCGPIGSALKAKYAANLFMIALATGIAESWNLARAQGVDLEAFGKVLNSGPMASEFSKVKIGKLLNEDWSPQASVKDCYNSTELIKAAAKDAQVQTPLIQLGNILYRDAKDNGWGDEDVMAIYKLFAQSPNRYSTGQQM